MSDQAASDSKARPPRQPRQPRAAAADGDGPPRERGTRRPGRAGTADRKIREGLTNTYQTIGSVVAMAGTRGDGDDGLQAFGLNIANGAEIAADAWMDLAEQNDGVRAALLKFTEGSAVANLIGVHVSMAFPLLVARGLIPAAVVNAMTPQPPSPNGNGAGA